MNANPSLLAHIMGGCKDSIYLPFHVLSWVDEGSSVSVVWEVNSSQQPPPPPTANLY